MRRLRPALRNAAYRTGALSLPRSLMRHALTVLMFHRVMDPADPDYAQADPLYTVSAPLFDELLQFFAGHYSAVRLQQVLDAADGKRPLPGHALLITFDDGWADNSRYAAPLLRAHGIPAAVFVAADAVQSATCSWWQEEVFRLGRTGALQDWLNQGNIRRHVSGTSASGTDDALEVVTRLALMHEDDRAGILASLPGRTSHRRMMMDATELRSLADFDIAVGVHGYRHVPLTDLADAAEELAEAQRAVADLTAGIAVTAALACPHGRYDAGVLAAAQELGFRLVFTSDKVLNMTEQGMLTRMRPLGRIPVIEAHICTTQHRLDTAAAARWLWSRECR
jgi:peptidoglycan/xylan/chitin deacetylase (PgdA/CDA1 family)